MRGKYMSIAPIEITNFISTARDTVNRGQLKNPDMNMKMALGISEFFNWLPLHISHWAAKSINTKSPENEGVQRFKNFSDIK